MVNVKDEDVKFLIEEYEIAQKELLINAEEERITQVNHYRGIKRGLEMALVRMGITNDELDERCFKVLGRFDAGLY